MIREGLKKQLLTTSPSPPKQNMRFLEDVVLQEAQNLIKLTNLETPLLGGENPDLAQGTGFEGNQSNMLCIGCPFYAALLTRSLQNALCTSCS
jgi:hypothetical protein